MTTPTFLTLWGLPSLRDLPDLYRLEEAGLIGRAPLPDELRSALGLTGADADKEAVTGRSRASPKRPVRVSQAGAL